MYMSIFLLIIRQANHQTDVSDGSSSDDNDHQQLQPPPVQHYNQQPALWDLQCFLAIISTM